MNTLLLASNIHTVEAMSYQFERVGMACAAAANVANVSIQARIRRPDLLILSAADILHTDQQVQTLTRLRREISVILVVFGDVGDARDQLIAKKLGAEELIPYPVPGPQLMKCVRRILWRHTTQRLPTPAVLEFGDLQVDPDRFEARVRGRAVPLTVMEMEILYYLGTHANRIVSREKLLNCVWCCEPSANMMLTINSHMRGLREKIEPDPGWPRYLITKRGIGYMLSTSAPDALGIIDGGGIPGARLSLQVAESRIA